MTHQPPICEPASTIAPLQNVSLCAAALEAAIHRPTHLPGLVCFYGPSGYGKSFGAAYVANRHRAYYVECKSSWTRRAVLVAILREMGVLPAKTIYEMVDQVAETLVATDRPLIIDELDHLVHKKSVEIIRDIYESSGAAILLIGEESVPTQLRRWERFHNRILDWVPAQPCDLEDARHLAGLYCPRIEIADDLLRQVLTASRGAARRIVVNIERVRQTALRAGWDRADAGRWGKRELYTGDAPRRPGRV